MTMTHKLLKEDKILILQFMVLLNTLVVIYPYRTETLHHNLKIPLYHLHNIDGLKC